MPELPEVESTARFLRERVKGETITAVTVHWSRTVATHSAAKFSEAVEGQKITDVGRRGKFVVFELAPGPERLYAHMRMSGSFDVLSASIESSKHDRLILTLSNGREIRFNDPRKFGRFYLDETPGTVVSKLGLEPLSEDFTVEHLLEVFKKHRGSIKPLLLRQDIVAGLGNIYVDEALWYARIHPLRRSETLKLSEIELLHQGIREILTEAISKAGTDFGDGVVEAGSYEPRVYGRGGKECHRCGGVVKRIVVGQRGTHLCARCQRKPRVR